MTPEREEEIKRQVQNASHNMNMVMLKALIEEVDVKDIVECINEGLNDIDRDELVAQLDDGI